MQFLARLGWISQPTPPTPSLTTLRLKSAPPSIEGLTLPRFYLTWTQTSRILQTLWSPCATAPPRHVHVSRPKQRWMKSWFLILVKDTVTTLTTLNLPDETCWSVTKHSHIISDSYLPGFLATISFSSGGGLEFWGPCSGNRLWGRGKLMIIFCLFGRKNI